MTIFLYGAPSPGIPIAILFKIQSRWACRVELPFFFLRQSLPANKADKVTRVPRIGMCAKEIQILCMSLELAHEHHQRRCTWPGFLSRARKPT